MYLKYYFLFTLFISVGFCDEEAPEVKTLLGRVKGYYRTANGGRKVSVFQGIPYAKPPVGERRFQPPEPVELWTGTWDASYLTECVQTNMLKIHTIEGEEDCLYVNVYVPREKIDPQDKLPVIVHIHGGNFMYGSGHSYAHPDFLMDRDVILVTFNYRLGIFGFLSTEDDVVSGNNGLKDQVMALKWIHKNIASFGGNPKSVTLTGLSAGGSSVHFHYLSDMSKGLFHRGFSQSGSALNPSSIQEEPLAKAKILAEAVGCPSSYSQVFIQCLKQRHYRHLITKMYLFFGYLSLPGSPFAPVIEKGSNPFLNKNPYDIMANGGAEDLPWIVSTTTHEGMMPAVFLFQDLQTIESNWTKLAPFLLDYNHSLPLSEHAKVADTIKKFYLGENQINTENFQKLVQIFTDRLFVNGAQTSAKLLAEKNKSPVYYYNFGFPGVSPNKTVSHGDDGQYFFFNMFQRKKLSPIEIQMKDVMLEMLISYAKTGKPTIPEITWEPTSYDKLTYLQIDGFEKENITLKTVYELAPSHFWNSLGFQENKRLKSVKDEL